MEDPRWLRLITIGLVLAAVAVGYFLLTGRLSSNVAKNKAQVNIATASATPAVVVTSPSPSVLGQATQVSPNVAPTSTPASAYSRIVSRTQGVQTGQTLPRTGFPIELAVVFSISTIISGWGLSRFPK
ncbi:hypothetical protein M1437_00545 [Patescibacteria group bacterium]|nr:hypothetical protein [Patescibacteria group bacterium]